MMRREPAALARPRKRQPDSSLTHAAGIVYNGKKGFEGPRIQGFKGSSDKCL
jgi:hypothetical protein